jgi:hypothetical protein
MYYFTKNNTFGPFEGYIRQTYHLHTQTRKRIKLTHQRRLYRKQEKLTHHISIMNGVLILFFFFFIKGVNPFNFIFF